jgi:hypothetical protein
VLADAGVPVPSRRLAVRLLAVARRGDPGCGETPQIEATERLRWPRRRLFPTTREEYPCHEFDTRW